jgi:hypothetical protein
MDETQNTDWGFVILMFTAIIIGLAAVVGSIWEWLYL